VKVSIAHAMLQQPDETLRSYNLWDCVATARIAKAMIQEMRDNRQYEFWHRSFWPLVEPVLAMQRRGLGLDVKAMRDLEHRLKLELLEIDTAIISNDPATGWLRAKEAAQKEEGFDEKDWVCPYDLKKAVGAPCGKSPNGLNSSDRVGVFLFDTLGLKTGGSTATGRRSVNQEALMRVLGGLRKKDEHARPVIYDLFHRSRLKTILQRYLHMVPDADGRLRPNVKMAGTETGRFAYSKPALQQAPPEIREIFVPASGCVFVSADYKQLEARISAYLTEDHRDIAVFEDPEQDIHTATALELFGDSIDPTNKSQFKAARNYAKTFRYRLMYGGNPDTLKSKTYCPCPRCEEHLPPTMNLPKLKIKESQERWLSNHSRIQSWRGEVSKAVGYDRSYTNPFGRKRFYFGPASAVRRECWNWPIQSTAADLINRAMVNGHRRYQLPFVLQMHDELMMEVPEGDLNASIAQLREVMEEPVPELGGVSFPVDVDVEVRWGVGA
jgi:DNA polymerase I-like protein with 3'-5' exonuclease and polymerase domains